MIYLSHQYKYGKFNRKGNTMNTNKHVAMNRNTTNTILKTQMQLKEEFAMLINHLKEYRAKLGVNQQQMGQLVGTSRQTISKIERGDYSPSVSLALRIAKKCDAQVEDIFELEDEDE